MHTSEGMKATTPKTKSSNRCIPISDNLTEILKQQRTDQKKSYLGLGKPDNFDRELVFTSLLGTPLNPNNVAKHYKKAIEKSGIPSIPFHGLRHTHASIMLQGNIHPKIISERLGHSSTSITLDIYSHLMPSMQEEAVKKFDMVFNEI